LLGERTGKSTDCETVGAVKVDARVWGEADLVEGPRGAIPCENLSTTGSIALRLSNNGRIIERPRHIRSVICCREQVMIAFEEARADAVDVLAGVLERADVVQLPDTSIEALDFSEIGRIAPSVDGVKGIGALWRREADLVRI
jgi:hypothetical protein